MSTSAYPDIDSAHFRQLLGRFATGVTVLTAADGGGPVGMTASSLASVSLVPPLISVCIERDATVHAAFLKAERFALNVLAENQEALSRRFAGPDAGRFEGVGYSMSELNLPLLDGAVAHIECAREAMYPGGDHTILIGRVLAGRAFDGRPLLYYRGGYASLGA